jgi:GNAT superfamily N-acetyltransferase
MDDWTVEPLARSHQRSSFSCGKPPLDDFLRQLVGQYEKRRLGRTYVGLRPGEPQVMGYYTLASGSVSFEDIPNDHARKLPRHSVPVVLLARLAVDSTAQGMGLGRRLLVDALERCLGLGQQLGIHAVEVDAIDDDARSFYEKYGFIALEDSHRHLYLPIAAIEDAFASR